MDKQKEINEMAVKIDELNEMNAENIVCDNAYECNHTYSCLACKKAEALNNAGYRKADDLLAENERLKKEIEIRDRALEKAIKHAEDMIYDFNYNSAPTCSDMDTSKQYIKQARQEMED